MKKYNSFLGAFFSGDNGQGGYNAAYRKGALASLYNGQLAPEQQNEVAANLSRVDPEAANKWQEDIVKQSANMLVTLGKDNPLAVQAWQTRIKPNLSRIYGAQADALPDVPDDNAFAIARQIAGVDANQDAMPADIRTNQWYLKQLGYKPGSKEEQDFLRMRAGQIPKAVPYGFKYDEQGNVWVEDRNQGNIRPGQFGGQNQPPPAGSGGIVFPEDIPPAAARVSDIMEAARREIGQLVAGGMPVDQATTLVTQKYAKGRGLTMPTQGQAPAASQSAPTAPTAPPRQAPVTPARVAVKPEKTYRIATAQEKAAVGIPADVPAQVGPDGKIDPINVPKPAGPSFSDETTFRKEYAAAVKPYRDVIEQYGRVEAAAKSPTAAGDLSLIFAYMKMLDPGSVVREGEFANAQNAAGLPDRVVNTYNNIVRGERLNPAQRADFLAQARNFKIQSEKQYEALDAQYRQMARDYNIPVDRVVTGTPPSGRKPTSGKELPTVNSRGWRLEVDKNGNRAYVSPDRKQFEEVQ